MNNESGVPIPTDNEAILAEKSLQSSFWLDACEDISYAFNNDFSLDATAGLDSVDFSSSNSVADDPNFFKGIDYILESIKNGAGLPSASPGHLGVHSTESIIAESENGVSYESMLPDGHLDTGNRTEYSCSVAINEQSEDSTGSLKINPANGGGGLVRKYENSSYRFQKHDGRKYMSEASEIEKPENRSNKRASPSVLGNGNSFPNKRNFHSRENSYRTRKRLREWTDHDHHITEKCRREYHTTCGRRRDWSESSDRDRMDRKAQGYWQRDPSGSKELVFRPGSYEAENKKESMVILPRVQENIRAKEKETDSKGTLLEDQARQYQLDVLDQAKNRNTIAFLETGSGKTLIAILLMKNVSAKLKGQDKRMLAVFLVPKIPLVYQQAEVIRAQTGFAVGHYCGDMGQNFWDARRWQREFESKQVLVMTAQILLNILRHSIIKMERIDILILDECHHAVKKHPYSLVMSEFYHTTPKEKRPSVFGMTASPVNLKGVSSQIDCAIKIRNLESKLDSTVCTVKDRKELEKHVPMPLELVVEYDKPACLWSLHEQVKQMELVLVETAKSSYKRSKWQFMGARDAGAKEELRQVYGLSERTESDGAANLLQKLRAINYALAELGQWCAYKVALSFLTALQNDEGVIYKIDAKFQESHLSKLVSLLQCELSEGAASEKCIGVETVVDALPDAHDIDEIEEGELTGSHVVSGGEHLDAIMGAAVADGKVTPKVQSLIKILLKYKHTDDFRAIIFVERVVTALALPKIFTGLQSLSFVKCACLIGHNNNQEMRTSHMHDVIAKFRDGKVTLLVATSVAEEGLDIRQCNVVIRFDLARTVLAYIQSRGRARKPGSDYILMVERENASHTAFLRNARNSEETLRKEAIERTDVSHLKDPRLILTNPSLDTFYKVENTGAMVSLNSAVGLVHFYCSQLPCDRYSILRPDFIMERHEKPDGSIEYSCKLQLPCNAPFEYLEGPICNSLSRAQQAVCLAACKKLHEMGAFTDMLLPEKGNAEVEKSVVDDGDPLPGMARYTEFYPEGVANILQGEWILSGSDTCCELKHHRLHVYTLKCTNIGSSTDYLLTQVSDFAVIFGNELDAEVLSMSVDLFVARSMITKASFLYGGPVDVTQDQLDYLKSFHVRLMSIVLDVDVEPATTPWDRAKAYLFVPLVNCSSADPMTEVNWDLIKNTVSSHSWSNPLQRARPDVYLGTDERTLGGERKEYAYSKLRRAYGQVPHPTYGVRGAVAPFDVVRASGLFPSRDTCETRMHVEMKEDKLMTADCWISAEELVGKIVTAVHSGKRFYVVSVCFEMTANNSFPKKDSYLDAVEYKSYADYYKQKYGVELIYKDQPLIRGRGVSYCKNLLSPRFENKKAQMESDETLEKMYYVFLPPELCLVHPLPGQLIRGAQNLPSIMRRVESMLLAVQLRDIIHYPIPGSKILEALTAASCQETYSYERAELLGDAYLKWVVSGFLFLKHPEKHEGQLTRMRQHMVSNMALYHYALSKGLQSYILADRFSPSRWAAPGVLPVFDEDVDEGESCFFYDEKSSMEIRDEHDEDDDLEDGELESDSSSYRVLSSKTLADVVEALIGVYYVEGGMNAANHFMKWVGIEGEFDHQKMTCSTRVSQIPDAVLKRVDFETLERELNVKLHDRSLLVEALTHASRPTSGVSCYQRLEFVGDAVLDHLITKHLFFTYTDLPPGYLTDLRAAAVNNENFARVAVKHKLHLHLRHGSSALEKQIRDFVKEVRVEIEKSGFNSFGLGDCKAPKVLGDIVESIAGALFVDNVFDTDLVWRVFEPLLQPIVTPETLPLHPVRELQERCQQQAEALEYKKTRAGNVAIVDVFIDGVQIASAQNSQRKMAQKLAARNTLAVLKERERDEAKTNASGKKRNGSQAFVRQTLNDICLRRNWPMPSYRCLGEGGPAHAKRFTFAVRVNTSERGWTDECVGEPMPNVKTAKDSAAVILLQLLSKWYQVQ